MENQLKRTILYFALVIIILSLVTWRFTQQPVFPSNKDQQCFIIKSGTSLKHIIYNLNVKHPFLLYAYARITGKGKHIQAGEYCMANFIVPKQFFYMLQNGKVMLHPFTIVDGWNVSQICEALAKQKSIISDEKTCNKKSLAGFLHLKQNSAEGWLYPNTYFYTYHSTAEQLLTRAYEAMDEQLNQAWQEREPTVPYKTKYQALIAASIIEKESANPDDEQVISGVIANRLNKNMPLQLDPTVMYGLGKRTITHDDIQIDTRYNTYKHYGLPPTPICMPSAAAIYAALHPVKTDYLYYVSKGDGTHKFSKTLTGQRLAIQHYYGK